MDSLLDLLQPESNVTESPQDVDNLSSVQPEPSVDFLHFDTVALLLCKVVNESCTKPGPFNPTSVAWTLTQAVGWATFSVELPTVLLASYALFRLVRAGHVAPVYVINLLASDLIQIANSMLSVTTFYDERSPVPAVIFYFGLAASVGFMLCIALERYLLVVWPLWYRCRRTIRHSLLASGGVWVSVGVFLILQSQFAHDQVTFFKSPKTGSSQVAVAPCGSFCWPQAVLLLLPVPLLLGFLMGTWRVLRRSTSVSASERNKILGVLLLVLGNYTLLFLPSIVVLLYYNSQPRGRFPASSERIDYATAVLMDAVALALLYVSPLVDTLLYIFLRQHNEDSRDAFSCLSKSCSCMSCMM
ncbi:oxoeicosanoid receptor 1 [Colossoma macropomum]|uniref:oxoeicosanoid receptor 1 n=1 Tax=Colossoma macropomum TaxID=42526 RepID=UPI0018655354|nr:oxoeicosanoid receptor 1 [Colossoma macropomum]